MNQVVLIGFVTRPKPRRVVLSSGERGLFVRLMISGQNGKTHHVSLFVPQQIAQSVSPDVYKRGTCLQIIGELASHDYRETVAKFLQRANIQVPPPDGEVPPWLDLNAAANRSSTYVRVKELVVVTPESLRMQ